MRQRRTGFRWVVGAVVLLAGCTHAPPMARSDRPSTRAEGPADPVTQVGHKETPASPVAHDGLANAEDAYRRDEFEKAEKMFEEIADDQKNRPEVAERARFYQAESLRRQGYYPKSVDTFNKLLIDFPAGLYREQAVGQMYMIASEWLQPVRDEIADKSKPEKDRKSKNWTDGIVLVNFDRKLPTFDTEGRALQTLEKAYFGDPTGPYADKALFMLGRVNYERGNYKEASKYFQQLAEMHDRSPLRDEALKLAIVSKNNSTGGPGYDGREAAEAMRLINGAKATSPALLREQEGKFLDSQALMVRYQQAEKDYETAEFYRRTGHPGSAWFYYELVKRRYPGLKPFADQAAARQVELKAKLDDMKDPSVASSTRRIWEQYVLGHDMPKDATANSAKELPKELPEARPAALPASAAVPADLRPRQ
ncbi:MAG TPA: tetratricopeptide repeat protein [Gemmataceae bacterium]|jgi:outer membrane protein assembly factor BamD (BamD/ComL family)|nr:tetratricopeptide repeat protein [Gemmataceae bacterium]